VDVGHYCFQRRDQDKEIEVFRVNPWSAHKEWYDLEKDPWEKRSLINSNKHKDTVDEMRGRLKEFLEAM